MTRAGCTCTVLALLALVAAGPTTKPTSKPKETPAQRIVSETRRILQESRTTWYSHKTVVNAKEGLYALDCSGLVCVVLSEVAPQHLANIPPAKGQKRQRAVEFHDSFAAAPVDAPFPTGWRKIPKLLNARPGDLLAWRHRNIVPNENTGHVVVIDETPTPDGDGLVRVTIIDATSLLHHNDTRPQGGSGVGRGTMWFTVDNEGQPTGYRWSSKTGRTVSTYPIAIGRAEGA